MSEQESGRSLAPGDRIAEYRIDAVAGRGGMGLVYRAWQERLQRVVAIKVIAPALAADAAFRIRFERESTLAAQIEHPNVIPVYQVGDHEGLLFIVMRYVEGVDLSDLLRRSQRIEPRHAARIVSQVAAALDAAHTRGLVHRDVKPGNVLVSGDPGAEHVYLTDFGITKRMADTSGLTASGMLVGTVDYLAPEQILGRRADARSDIYALGCMLYEVLAGTVPFPRETEVAKIFAHVNDAPEPLRRIAPAVPAELEAVVAKAMAKNPDDRYLSAGDMGRAEIAGAEERAWTEVPRSVASGPAAAANAAPTSTAQASPITAAGAVTVESGPEATPEQARDDGRRRRLWWLSGGAAVVIAAAVLAVSISGGGGMASSSPQSVVRAWVAAYNAADHAKAASYFAVGARVNGSALTTRADVLQFQSYYACALQLRSTSAQGTTVTVDAVNVRGPRHPCAGLVGTTDTIRLRVQNGMIIYFSRT